MTALTGVAGKVFVTLWSQSLFFLRRLSRFGDFKQSMVLFLLQIIHIISRMFMKWLRSNLVSISHKDLQHFIHVIFLFMGEPNEWRYNQKPWDHREWECPALVTYHPNLPRKYISPIRLIYSIWLDSATTPGGMESDSQFAEW